ncbi:MAG TPA: hypothetical protein PKG52_03965 [bacterium]|nr:hypothetical protein [bacterium]HPS29954.1 hypothetical protein [bacterium]
MKKLIALLLLICCFGVFYYYNEYSKYSITYSCVEIIEHGNVSDVKAELSIPGNENKCLNIETGQIGRSNFVKDMAGVKYKVFFVQPEKKNDEHLGKTSDEIIYELPENKKEKVFEPDVKYEQSDISIVFINTAESQGFTSEEIMESVINVQTIYPDVDLIVTNGFKIPEDRIIRKSVKTVNTMGVSSIITVGYKVILDENRNPFSVEIEDINFSYPDTGKKKKM